jgi:hypothetical protein
MRFVICVAALDFLSSVAGDAGSCGFAGGFPMSEAERTYLALEAASRRPDYE